MNLPEVNQPWRSPFVRWSIALGLLMHGVVLAVILASPVAPGAEPRWSMPDTPSYLANAQMLGEGRPLSPVFRERLMLPALIDLVQSCGGRPEYMLWLVWLLHVPAALAAAWLAARYTPGRWAPRLAAALYFLWPAVFAAGTLVSTDMLHAQLVLVAVALTVAWSDRGGTRTWTPLSAWWAVQLTRPSFYPAVLVLVPFLFGLWRRPGGARRPAVALVLGLLSLPLIFTLINQRQYGIAAPSLAGVESLHRNVVARIRALQHNERAPGLMTDYFLEEREHIAKADPDWQALQIYRAGGGQLDFATHYRNLQERGNAFVSSNRSWFIRSSLLELENQLRRVHAVPGIASVAGGSAAGDAWLLRLHKVGLLLALTGWALCLRRSLAYPVFFALCCGLVLAACSMLWWENSRIRMPLEALAIPLVAACLLDRKTGWALGGILLLGWFPVRAFGASETWTLAVAALVLLTLVCDSLRGWRMARPGGVTS